MQETFHCIHQHQDTKSHPDKDIKSSENQKEAGVGNPRTYCHGKEYFSELTVR